MNPTNKSLVQAVKGSKRKGEKNQQVFVVHNNKEGVG